LMNDVCVVMFM